LATSASICHCGEPNQTESVPQIDVVDPHALEQCANQRGAEFRMRYRRVGKGRAKLGKRKTPARFCGTHSCN
jgi:hypothetical protein